MSVRKAGEKIILELTGLIMAKAMVACFRRRRSSDPVGLGALMDARLRPDNGYARPTSVHSTDGLVTCVYNPPADALIHGPSVALGVPFGSLDPLTPGAASPDGAFAIFRADDAQVEVLSDYTASRSIYYCFTDDVFVASTSQRMIVLLLGDFSLNPSACKWMLTNGHLGPTEGWDARFQLMPPNSRLFLNRATWSLVQEDGRSALAMRPARRSREGHKTALKAAVTRAISGLKIDGSRWTLALSGGVDSRSILYHLKDTPGLDLVTWGLSESCRSTDNDAAIARRLASMCGIPHRYAETDVQPESLPVTIDRFLAAGEGRIDHLSGYMDGLAFWGSLSASGRGILRGYDGSGPKPPVISESQARRTANLYFNSDFRSPKVLREWARSTDDLPVVLRRNGEESLVDWRDRLWLQFRTPLVTAALDDIKLAYVEVANPLLSRSVVQTIQSLPHELRTRKALFREIVQEMFPGVPFAGRIAIQRVGDIIRLPGFARLFEDEMERTEPTSAVAAALRGLLRSILNRPMARETLRWRVRGVLRRYLPPATAHLRQRILVHHDSLDSRRVALRALLILRMQRLLQDDAALAWRGGLRPHVLSALGAPNDGSLAVPSSELRPGS